MLAKSVKKFLIVNHLSIAALGVCTYLVSFCYMFTWDIPLAILVISALLSLTALDKQRPIIKANRKQNFYHQRTRQKVIGGKLKKSAPSAAQKIYHFSSALVPLAAYLIVTVLAIVLSSDSLRSLSLSIAMLPALLIFVMITIYFQNMEEIKWVSSALLVLGILITLQLFFVAFSMSDHLPEEWIKTVNHSILVVPNDIVFMALVLPLSIHLFIQQPKGLHGILSFGFILLSIAAIVLLRSRLSLLLALIACGIYMLLIKPKYLLKTSILILLAGFLADWFFGFQLLAKFSKFEWTRLVVWKTAWLLFLDHPIIGAGPNTFSNWYEIYLTKLHLPVAQIIDKRHIPWVHNLYLEFLAERGILGLATLLGLLARPFYLTLQLCKSEDPIHYQWGAAFFSVLAVFALASFVELSFLRLWVVIVFFTLAGLIEALARITAGTINS